MPVYNGKATDFVNFTRGSLATVTDSDGKIKWAPHNLLTNSESFGATAWFKNNVTVEENSIAAPNGTTTADRIKEITDTTVPSAIQNITAAGATITFSVFAKTAQRSAIYLRLYNNTNVWEAAVFDLNAGTNPQNASGSATTFTNRSQTITPIGGGWNLCSITATFPSSAVGCNIHISNISSGITFNSSGDYAYAGNAANGVYLWGAHLYRSDLGGMQSNGSAYPMYNPTTPKNLLGSTEDFSSGSGWQHNSVTVTKNAALAPNGTQTANKIVETSANLQHYVTVSLTLSGIYTFSVYAKAAERTHINLWFNSFGAGAAYFNLTNGTYTLNAGNYVVAADMISIGGGWYRCSVKSATFPSATYFPVIGIGDTQTYVGDTTKGVYIWGAQLSDSASLDPYVANHFAAPTSAAYYGPRLDYDPVTRASKGMLVEAFRTNLILNSNNLSNFSITPVTGLTSTLNAGIAPTGTNIARLLVNTTTTEQHRLFYNLTLSNATTYTYSVYAKKDTANWLQLTFFRGITLVAYANFNLATGTKGFEGGGATAVITPVGEGWYRCSVTATTEGTGANVQLYVLEADTNSLNPSTTGTGKGLYVWGAQLEAGAFATSYIPTGASTVDRNADVGQVSVNAIPYSTNECTFVIDVQRFAGETGDEGSGVEFSTGAFQTNIIQMMYDYGSYNAVNTRVFSSGGSLVLAARGGSSPNLVVGELPRKIGVALKSGNTVVAATGLLGATSSTTFTIPQTTRLKFSTNSDGAQGNDFMGWIRNITYLPRRVTNEELQQRTL
jgi:hypothetical protein